MLTSKQRAHIRGQANSIETILILGKGGIGDTVINQADSALEARELIKGKVLENCQFSSREAAEILAEKCSADVVQVIGSKFVLYRENPDEPVIVLPKARSRSDAKIVKTISTEKISIVKILAIYFICNIYLI